jgi:hypothetical protein
MTLEEYNKQRKSFEREFDEALSKYRLIEPRPASVTRNVLIWYFGVAGALVALVAWWLYTTKVGGL